MVAVFVMSGRFIFPYGDVRLSLADGGRKGAA